MYQALSIHDVLAKKISKAQKFKGKIHSKFDKAVNLKLDGGDLFSLLVSSIDKSPTSIIINLESFTNLNVGLGDSFYLDESKLVLGTEEFSLEYAIEYSLNLPEVYINSEYLKENVSMFKEYIEELMEKVSDPIEELIYKKIFDSAIKLKQAEKTKVELIFKSLVGMGIGLTPSGDDFLVGLISVASLKNSGMKQYLDYFQKMLIDSKNSTNEISYSVLINAARGYFKEVYSDFLEVVFSRRVTVEDFERILSIGYSSGKDTLIGMLTGLEILELLKN